MQNVNHNAYAKKIADVVSDGRLASADLDTVALLLVMHCREDAVLERMEYLFDRFVTHRNAIGFGSKERLTLDEISDMVEA